MAAGDHVWVQRFIYTHHGVEVYDNEVVHFTGAPNVYAQNTAPWNSDRARVRAS